VINQEDLQALHNYTRYVIRDHLNDFIMDNGNIDVKCLIKRVYTYGRIHGYNQDSQVLINEVTKIINSFIEITRKPGQRFNSVNLFDVRIYLQGINSQG